jgi:hypothetical protein
MNNHPVHHLESIPIPDIVPSPQELADLTATVLGFAGGGISEWILSGGRIIGAFWLGRVWKQFLSEIKYFRDKGKIKEDYFKSSQNFENLSEILDYFDKGVPSEQVWDVLKKIYLVAANESVSKRDDILPQQFIRLAKSLTSTEVIVLFTAYRKSVEVGYSRSASYLSIEKWTAEIATNSKLQYTELVSSVLPTLIAKNFIVPTFISGAEYFKEDSYFGLTKLGKSICEYVAKYDVIDK